MKKIRRTRRHVTKRQYKVIQERKNSPRRSDKSDNRVVCNKTGRPKFLYPTLKKALLACKYSENPQRPYYCDKCCGYHTTSESKDEYYDNLEKTVGHPVVRTERKFELDEKIKES